MPKDQTWLKKNFYAQLLNNVDNLLNSWPTMPVKLLRFDKITSDPNQRSNLSHELEQD
jgi:hypothetical protein